MCAFVCATATYLLPEGERFSSSIPSRPLSRQRLDAPGIVVYTIPLVHPVIPLFSMGFSGFLKTRSLETSYTNLSNCQVLNTFVGFMGFQGSSYILEVP